MFKLMKEICELIPIFLFTETYPKSRMSMDFRILKSKTGKPYSKLPPLHVAILCSKEEEKTLSWSISGEGVSKGMTKKKRVMAITDGKEVERVVVFESVSLQFVDKKGYMLTGYALRGENPPFSINFTRETKLFSSVGVPITPDLEERGRQLLYPPSLKCSLRAAREETAMVSVQGKVKEVSSVGKVQVGRDFVPRKTLTLEQVSSLSSLSIVLCHSKSSSPRNYFLAPTRSGPT
ncbi:uncharacterized protein LOC117809117 [Notolabrus celidotus]|uniref:uncharacterized protein LOC117809117 n=1 Tax=Notolabrus celidotus TaxID=1203425 RepID=UPI00148F943E|nr:uncharacterized protein LOC117809117 [Notolabrus celidotus]